jgi:glycosyltransferase involved in cell wall biosynthesis
LDLIFLFLKDLFLRDGRVKKIISVIVPVFNEYESIPFFYEKMKSVLEKLEDYDSEIIFINDGSTDGSISAIDCLISRDDRVGIISLSRNFGKELAMTAGMDYAIGDAIAIFDVDLQDPPELLLNFVSEWERGYDVVYAKRIKRNGETWLKKFTATLFYKVIGKLSKVIIPRDTGDCRLMSRRVIDQLTRLREQHRFMKGLFAWVGFSSVAVEYERDARLAGESKFNYWRLWNFALEGITSFTIAPLKISMYLGFATAIISAVFGVWIIFKTIFWGEAVRGYPTLIVTVLILGGVQLFFIGILGEYIGRIFGETKNRPLYIVERFEQPLAFKSNN